MTKQEYDSSRQDSIRVLSCLVGALLFGAITMSYAGWDYIKDPAEMPWRLLLTIANSMLLVSGSSLIFLGCIMKFLRHIKMKHWGNCIGFFLSAAFCIMWAATEMLRIYTKGFFPIDPLIRTLALLPLLPIGMFLIPSPSHESGCGNGNASKPEAEDSSKSDSSVSSTDNDIGLKGALVCVIAFAVFTGFFIDLGWSPDERPADTSQNVQTLPFDFSALPQPASYDELSKAFVCICVYEPPVLGGSGVFVGIYKDGKREVSLMTAAHVAAENFKNGITNEVGIIPYRGNGQPDIPMKLNDVAKGWSPCLNYTDIAIVDVTPYFDSMVKQGWDVRYIPMFPAPKHSEDDRAIEGACLLPSKYFAQYGIGMGTPVTAMGCASELWTEPFISKRQPLALRTGVIASRVDFIKGLAPSENPPIIIEANLNPGYSGGPIFASVFLGEKAYPILIGVATGGIRIHEITPQSTIVGNQHSGLSYFTPLDAFFKTHSETESENKQ